MFTLGVFTDEISHDFGHALDVSAELGIGYLQLRTYQGKNLIDLDWGTLEKVREIVLERRFKVVAIASPLLKCPLPESPPIRGGDHFSVTERGYDRQMEVLAKSIEIARFFDTNLVRCFAFWRGAAPFEEVRGAIAERMRPLVAFAEREGIVLGLENEYACYASTGAETRALIDAVNSRALRVTWDPANAVVGGERAYPDGYEKVREFIVDVHLKDATYSRRESKPDWKPVGEGAVDTKGLIAALMHDGYVGAVSLEGHYAPPGTTKEDGIRRSFSNLTHILDGLSCQVRLPGA